MKIRKMQTAAGGPLRLTPEELKYYSWINMSPELRRLSRNNRVKAYLLSGPNITNFWEAFQTYIGNRDPKNPHLITGEPSIPGMNPTKGILMAAKASRTLKDYLKTTKVTAQALEGSSAARSAYATDRYLGGVMFENNLPEAASQIQGHGMAKASTLLENLARLRYILDNGLEKGKTFFTAPLKVSNARIGSALGTGGGKPYFDGHFLITGKPGLMINSIDDIGTIYINDAYENEEALKAALKLLQYLLLTYPKINFKLYSLGFKQGGKMNIIEKFKKGRKIKRALFGTNLDVDNRSDTTRLGYGSIPTWGAANASNTAGLWDLLNYNVTGNPNIITGEPDILPGKVNMSLYKNAKHVLKGVLTNERFVNFVDRLAAGKINPRFITKNGSVSPAIYNYVDLKSESVPKGFVKGNEITPDWRYPISEEGLTIRNTNIGELNNPITNAAEALAARDFITELKAIERARKTSSVSKKHISLEKNIVRKNVENAKVTLSERYHDRKNYTKTQRTKDKNARSMEYENAKHTNSGTSRVKNSQIGLVIDNIEKYPKYELKKLEGIYKRLARKGLSRKDIDSNKEVKDFYKYLGKTYGYFKQGGTIEFLKKGSGIHIKEENRGKSTNYITTGGAGYFPDASKYDVINGVKTTGKKILNKVRQVLYNRVDPYSYDIGQAVSQLVSKGRETKKNDVYDALWAKYLNRSNKQVGYNIDEYLEPAQYVLTKGKPLGTLYRLNRNLWGNDGYRNTLHPLGDNQLYHLLKSGKNSRIVIGSDETYSGLGDYTVSLGQDEKGKYMSYYDEWDISPIGNKSGKEGKDQSFGIGTPFSVYDRRYYTDEEAAHILSEYDKFYQSVKDASKNQSVKHDIYTVKPYRPQKRDGGSIHIAPSKRGTFTAAATKHGMGVQEFASKVLRNKEDYSPSLVKKANFARNARKFKHLYGGNLGIRTLKEDTIINDSPIAKQHFLYQLDFNNYLYNKKKLLDELKLLEQLLKLERTNSLLDKFSGTVILYLPNILNKNGVPISFTN